MNKISDNPKLNYEVGTSSTILNLFTGQAISNFNEISLGINTYNMSVSHKKTHNQNLDHIYD